ncbi:MAG: HIT domain-containing protein [Candidatus Woesearchaeota archaeon]
MNKDCPFCQKMASKDEKLYEDEKVAVMLSDTPATIGHLLVMPKEHYPIIEQVPDFIVEHALKVANKISVAVFETLKVQGTNIIVNNGIAAGQDSAHFMIHVIPRKENDGLNLQWQPKQMGEEEMSTIELQLKEETKNIGSFQKEKEEPVEMSTEREEIKASGRGESGQGEVPEESTSGEQEPKSGEKKEEENYLIKQWRKIP